MLIFSFLVETILPPLNCIRDLPRTWISSRLGIFISEKNSPQANLDPVCKINGGRGRQEKNFTRLFPGYGLLVPSCALYPGTSQKLWSGPAIWTGPKALEFPQPWLLKNSLATAALRNCLKGWLSRAKLVCGKDNTPRLVWAFPGNLWKADRRDHLCQTNLVPSMEPP